MRGRGAEKGVDGGLDLFEAGFGGAGSDVDEDEVLCGELASDGPHFRLYVVCLCVYVVVLGEVTVIFNVCDG